MTHICVLGPKELTIVGVFQFKFFNQLHYHIHHHHHDLVVTDLLIKSYENLGMMQENQSSLIKYYHS